MVLIGTLYPLLLESIGGGQGVGRARPFFNTAFLPLATALIGVMAIGPMLAWKRADLAGALGRLKLAAAASVIIGLGALYWQSGGPVLAPLGMAFAAWAFFGALTEFAERIPPVPRALAGEAGAVPRACRAAPGA